MEDRTERIGKNEALFREVNERIETIADGQVADFLCECGDAACTAPITLTLAEYEAVRAEPDHFAIVPGHELPDVERVVADHGRFAVVEKLGAKPADIAAEHDPRS